MEENHKSEIILFQVESHVGTLSKTFTCDQNMHVTKNSSYISVAIS